MSPPALTDKVPKEAWASSPFVGGPLNTAGATVAIVSQSSPSYTCNFSKVVSNTIAPKLNLLSKIVIK